MSNDLRGESQITNYSPAELRGRDAYCDIRDRLQIVRSMGREVKIVWVNPHTIADMKALWKRATAKQNPQWDEMLPMYVAGVPMLEGSTGGSDYLFEYIEDAIAEALREARGFRRDYNPLAGTH